MSPRPSFEARGGTTFLKQGPTVVMGRRVRGGDPLRDYALSLVAVDDGTSTGSSDGINRVRSRPAGIAR